jgi:gliding motility associated protien GldN
MKRIIILAITLAGLWSGLAIAQNLPADTLVRDTMPAFDENLMANDPSGVRPFPYPKISQANIRLYARVWRVIDLDDTANAILTVPGRSLMETIMTNIKSGKLTPYEKDDFKKRLSAKDGELRFADSVLVPKFDKDGNQISSKMVLNDFNPDKIRKFRIEEDVFFDKQRGKVDTRIIAVAPMLNLSGTENLPANYATAPAFWLYFPQLRYALIKVDLSDPDKNIFDITMDDVFMQHKFNAYLVKLFSPGGAQTEQLDPNSPEAQKIEAKLASLNKNIWRNPRGVDDKKPIKKSDKTQEDKP